MCCRTRHAQRTQMEAHGTEFEARASTKHTFTSPPLAPSFFPYHRHSPLSPLRNSRLEGGHDYYKNKYRAHFFKGQSRRPAPGLPSGPPGHRRAVDETVSRSCYLRTALHAGVVHGTGRWRGRGGGGAVDGALRCRRRCRYPPNRRLLGLKCRYDGDPTTGNAGTWCTNTPGVASRERL